MRQSDWSDGSRYGIGGFFFKGMTINYVIKCSTYFHENNLTMYHMVQLHADDSQY